MAMIRSYSEYKAEMEKKEPSMRRLSEFALRYPDEYQNCRERYAKEAEMHMREHNRALDKL